MAIIEQCQECKAIDKKKYCGNCKKSIDYFEVFKYSIGNDNKVNMIPIHIVKAYTWNDVIKFVKDKHFSDDLKPDINCEKDFTYIDGKMNSSDLTNHSIPNIKGCRIYMNNKIASSTVSNSVKDFNEIIDITHSNA